MPIKAVKPKAVVDDDIYAINSIFLSENYLAKEQDFRAFVIAKDKAGNITKERIRYYLINRKYRNSNIALKDGFLDGKIEPSNTRKTKI